MVSCIYSLISTIMNNRSKLLFMKKDYIFNTIAGLVDASEAVIMSMIITRTVGLKDAGYITIAFAVGILLVTIGKYGVYNYQVSDVNNRFHFIDYLYNRIITTLIMIICLSGYLIYLRYILKYDDHKILIILYMGLIYVIESFEDLIRAHCQYCGKLYIGAIMFIIRWIVIITTFGILICVFKNTVSALGGALLFSLVAFVLSCIFIKSRNLVHSDLSLQSINSCTQRRQKSFAEVRNAIKMLYVFFPLFLSSFLSFYVINAPKYAIEKYMNAESLACYGFVSMPVFVIGMFNNFIYLPQLSELSIKYANNEISEFKHKVMRQYLIIGLITLICVSISYFIGISFLSFIYHTDLTNYLTELLVLMICGGFLALSGYQSTILTIMRRQKFILWGYIPVSVFSFSIIYPIVKKYGTLGAAFSYLFLSVLLCILFEIFTRIPLPNHREP